MDMDAENATESRSKRTPSSPSTNSPNTNTSITSTGSPSISAQRTRRARHRHTQSLGLLSPIPSRSSLRSDAAADEFEFNNNYSPTVQATRARTPPPRSSIGTPKRGNSTASTTQSGAVRSKGSNTNSTISNTSTPSIASMTTTTTSAGAGGRPATPRRAPRASLAPLPALLASMSALFPTGGSDAPSSPQTTMPTPTSPTAATDGSGSSLRSGTAAADEESEFNNNYSPTVQAMRARTPPPCSVGTTLKRGDSKTSTPHSGAARTNSTSLNLTTASNTTVSSTTTTTMTTSTESGPAKPMRASLPPLPALLASLGALFPSSTSSSMSAPSSPKVASASGEGEMSASGEATSPTVATDGSSNVILVAPQPHLASSTTVVPHAPQPRRAASFTPYQHPDASSLLPSQPQSQLHAAPTQTPQRPPSASSASAPRSEQLLRDALRRGSTSSVTRPNFAGHKRSSSSALPLPSYSPQHQHLVQGGGSAYAYGGDSEFSSSHPPSHSHQTSPSAAALSHTLSRLEGRVPTPSRERDPDHEALRARLERVLALNAASGGGSGSGSPRSSLSSDRRSSFHSQSGSGSGVERRTSQRTSLSASTSASGSRPSTSSGERQAQHNDRGKTPRPHTPSRPRTPLNHTNTANAPGSPRTPTPWSPHTPRTGGEREGDTPRSARRRTVTGDGESPHPSPRFQQAHLTTSPHSPLQSSPHYRTTSPRPHILAFNSAAELPRRHTTPTPTASPRRAQFGLQRSVSPAQSRDGTERGHVRQRSRTEPSSTTLAYGVAGEQYGALPEMVGEQRRDRERAHGEGHARKSSAYAALAALSGLGVGHPSARHHARTGSLNGFAPHLQPTNGSSATGNGPPTPGSTPPLSADVRDETSTSESEEGEDEDDSEHGHRQRRRGGNGKLLTPPATPPRCSLVVVAGSDDGACANGCLHPHDGEPRPTFNARKASAQCRQLEGYVSFAAVEGLGEPPSPGPDGDLDDEDAAKRKRGSSGTGIVGFWKGGFW